MSTLEVFFLGVIVGQTLVLYLATQTIKRR